MYEIGDNISINGWDINNFLKGNYKLDATKNVEKTQQSKPDVQEELKNKALASLGGSMVYVERNKLNWDGDE